MFKGLQRQIKEDRIREQAAVGIKFLEDLLIFFRVADNGRVLVILRRGTQHRRAADIDILDSLLQRHVLLFITLSKG